MNRQFARGGGANWRRFESIIMQSGPGGARASREEMRWYRGFLGDKQLSAANEARCAVPIRFHSLVCAPKEHCYRGQRGVFAQPLGIYAEYSERAMTNPTKAVYV